MSAVDAIGVVIPAHDEEELLGACLDAMEVAVLAARAAGARVEVVVVLDACTDGSAAIAAAHDVTVIEVSARRVGAARAAGVRKALELLDAGGSSGREHQRVWTAHTDADSTVPPHWLTHQLALARGGADVMIGTVRPDFRDLTREQVDAWWLSHVPGVANGHVHGANLGVRASTLLAAGGFPPLAAHEDVALVDMLRRAGARLAASDAAWVSTSGRHVSRAPEGYARYLRDELPQVERFRRPREISLL